jgi:hypothetical protein
MLRNVTAITIFSEEIKIWQMCETVVTYHALDNY